MKPYQPATPRTTLGVLAFALTMATFGLFVAGPAALIAQADGTVVATQKAAAPV